MEFTTYPDEEGALWICLENEYFKFGGIYAEHLEIVVQEPTIRIRLEEYNGARWVYVRIDHVPRWILLMGEEQRSGYKYSDVMQDVISMALIYTRVEDHHFKTIPYADKFEDEMDGEVVEVAQ